MFESVSFALAKTVAVTVFPCAGTGMPPSLALTTIVTVALALLAISPSLQTTVPSTSLQVPWDQAKGHTIRVEA